jgi:catechol 2,3-dioxygenase-like lactoylglutathione lyase family enzyme
MFSQQHNRMKAMAARIGVLALAVFSMGHSEVRAQSPDLAGIAHVAFRVSDVRKSRDFYGSLGFEQAFEFADAGKPPVSYIKINDQQFVELYGGANASQPTGLMHVCYEATDIGALWNEYVKRGLNPPESKKGRAGNLLFMLRDPEGQLLEFTQYLPGSLHSEDSSKHLGVRRISEHLMRASFPVKAVASERTFYTEKLAFAASATGAQCLRLPGNSGEEVELRGVSSSVGGVALGVANIAAAEKELRSRGLTPQSKGAAVVVSDPDGFVIEFVLVERKTSGKG